jgi:hypothetical protein
MVHLDNHISKAKWCCDTNDGNSWFGDREFDAEKWRRAWGYMANHVSSRNNTLDSDAYMLNHRPNHGLRLPVTGCVMSFAVQTRTLLSNQYHTTGTIGIQM